MAQEKIIINFKAAGHEALITAVKQLDNAIADLKNETRKYGKEGGKWVKNNRLLDNSFATLRSKMLLFNFAMGLGVSQLIKFTKQAAKLQDVRRAFDTLQGGAGRGAIAIDKLKEATDGTVTEFDLFQQANNAMILGVTKNSEKMAEMFDIAQRLGQALGKDTKLSVESLITGIGRQSRMMLDNIGIVVDVEKANKAYAEQLGINANQLTDQDKKTAFLNATMDSARNKVEELGEEQLSNSQTMDQMSVAVTEAATALGESLMPIVIPLAKALTALAKGAKVVFEAFDPHTLGVAFTETAEELEFLTDMLDEHEKIMRKLGAVQLEFMGQDMGLGFKEMSSELQPLVEQHKEYKDRIAQLQEELKNLFNLESEESLDDITVETKLLGNSINAMSNALASAAINGEHMGDAVVNSLKAIAAQLVSKIAVYTLMTALFPGAAAGLGGKGSALKFALGIAHDGGLIKNDGKVQRFATGGSIRGGDNVPILAQGGEFVMQRSAVESIGIENLNRMNQGSSGAINVSVSGNVMSQDFVEGELADQIKNAVRRGTDFGIG